ncbi:MAG: hypothetical protein AB1758_36650, partial [Candidatus Eremiobacterota bacterium]
QTYDLVERGAALDKDMAKGLEDVIRSGETTLGLSWKNDILPASTGELAMLYETFDVLVAQVREAANAWSGGEEAVEEEGQQPPDWVPDGPTPEAGSDFRVGELPYTFVIGLKPGNARQEIVGRLRQKLGSSVRMEPHAGVEVYRTKDDNIAYAVYGNYLIISTGGTSRLMSHLLDSLTGRIPPISRLASYESFRRGLKGRLILASHQKVDDVYSMFKGMLLLVGGAEFRAEATSLGRWRDSYSAVTVEPDGVRIRTAVFATEQVP